MKNKKSADVLFVTFGACALVVSLATGCGGGGGSDRAGTPPADQPPTNAPGDGNEQPGTPPPEPPPDR